MSIGLIAFAVLVRYTLALAGQQWATTYAHTLSIVLLPLITYIITSVISGNIALSLGMVGAMSIVRFRNPVKSPFELVVYFLLITSGIAASVDMSWLLLLATISTGTLLGAKLIDTLVLKFSGNSLFQVSFSEGNELPTITMVSAVELDELLNHRGLISYTSDKAEYEYVLASRDKNELVSLANSFKTDERVTAIRYLTY